MQEIIASRSRTAQSLALHAWKGPCSRLQQIKNLVLDVLSVVEVQLDYAEDETGAMSRFLWIPSG